MGNKYLYICSVVIVVSIPVPCLSKKCELIYNCPSVDTVDTAICGIYPDKERTLFRSTCVLRAYELCHNITIERATLRSCIKTHFPTARRFDDESCPVFCPEYYRPVCAASKFRDYQYRSFINGCYLDMVNCRGYDDSGYVEVPLWYCQRHGMKNIWKEQVVTAHSYDRMD